MIDSDDQIIVKLKQLHWTDERISKRLGISAEEVNRRWVALTKAFLASQENGYGHLVEAFTLLCQQYQVVGESLKAVAEGLNNIASPGEIKSALKIIPNDGIDEVIADIQANFIVLKPFTIPTPEEMIRQAEQN